jgi:hypothetical protein
MTGHRSFTLPHLRRSAPGRSPAPAGTLWEAWVETAERPGWRTLSGDALGVARAGFMEAGAPKGASAFDPPK